VRVHALTSVVTTAAAATKQQAVAGARLVKMSAWEPALSREISNARAAEVRTAQCVYIRIL
jgi:hypothetical protein